MSMCLPLPGVLAEKLARLGRYSSHIVRYDIVLDHERNPRQSKVRQRVEIIGRGKGPTLRAESMFLLAAIVGG